MTNSTAIPDAVNKQISDTCQAIQQENILVMMKAEGDVIVLDPRASETKDIFLQFCDAELKDAYQYQIRNFNKANLWRASDIHDAAKYFQDHHVDAYFVSMSMGNNFTASPYNPFTAIPYMNSVFMGLAGFVSPSVTQFAKTHEFGHIQDLKLLSRVYPTDSKLLTERPPKDEKEHLQSTRFTIEVYFKAIRSEIPATYLKEFDRNQKLIFDSSKDAKTLSGVYTIVTELFRTGEETDPKRLQTLIDEGAMALLKKTTGKPFNLHEADPMGYQRMYMVAYLQVTGLWDCFQKKPDFNTKSVKDLPKEQILFFKHAIEASARFHKRH